MREAVIVAAKRTPVGKAKRGALVYTRVEDIAKPVIEKLLEVTGVKGDEVNDFVMGCAMPEAEQGMNIARIVSLYSGLAEEVPAMTVNRFCSSGIETIAIASTRVMAGFEDIVIAGGAETMSMIPMGGNKIVGHPVISSEMPGVYASMGNTSEQVVERYGEEYNLTREELDKFGLESNLKAAKAIEDGKFAEETVSVPYTTWKNGKKIEAVLEVDEGPRADSTMEGMAKLRPAFKMKGGVVTAANSSQMNDGAAFVMIMSREEAEKRELEILGIMRDYQVVGVDPTIMGVGPAYAIPKLLEKNNLKYEDIDVYEINEAFASQALYSVRKMGIEHLMDRINVNGGAIALGHPLGCTGGKLTVQLLHEMKRRGARYGVVSMCIGGGMGAAGLYEIPPK